MLKFLKKIALFLSFPLFIILFMDTSLRMQNSLFKEKYEGAKESQDSIEIVILGTSRATYGVNPEAFDLYAYNLANLGQSLYFDKRITLSLLPEMNNLKYAFISIDYHSLAFSSQHNGDFWSYYGNGIKYKDTDYTWANISPTLFGYTPKVAYAMIKNRFVNLWKHGSDIVDFEVHPSVDIYQPAVKGFVALEGRDSLNFNHEAYIVSSKWYTEVIDESDEKKEIVEDLEDFIEILLAEEVTPILFSPPTYIEYNSYLNQSHIEYNIQTSEHIAKKYGIKFWDFHDSKIFSIDDFHDMEHLNTKGALKFSNMLNDSIKKMHFMTTKGSSNLAVRGDLQMK